MRTHVSLLSGASKLQKSFCAFKAKLELPSNRSRSKSVHKPFFAKKPTNAHWNFLHTYAEVPYSTYTEK